MGEGLGVRSEGVYMRQRAIMVCWIFVLPGVILLAPCANAQDKVRMRLSSRERAA